MFPGLLEKRFQVHMCLFIQNVAFAEFVNHKIPDQPVHQQSDQDKMDLGFLM